VASGGGTNQTSRAKGVALLLLAVALIAGGFAYVIAGQYRSIAELQDAIASQQTTLKTVNDTLARLRDDNSAGLTALRAENADLRTRLAAAEARVSTAEAAISKSQQRNPNAIYQLGAEVGRVAGAREDRAASTVTFESIDGGSFDRGKEFDWRDLVLKVTKHESATTSFTGRGVQVQMTGVQATIVRTRGAP